MPEVDTHKTGNPIIEGIENRIERGNAEKAFVEDSLRRIDADLELIAEHQVVINKLREETREIIGRWGLAW